MSAHSTRAKREQIGRFFSAWLVATAVICLSAGNTEANGLMEISPDGSLLAVVNPDSGTVSVLPLPDLEPVAEVTVGDRPETLAFSPSGERLFVALGGDRGVVAIEVESGRTEEFARTPDAPFGLATTQAGELFVSVPDANRIEVFDAATLAPLGVIETGRAPRGLLLDPSGHRLFATHFFGGQLSVIDPAGRKVVETIPLNPDANFMQGLALDARTGRLYLPHTRSNSANRALVFDATVFPTVGVIDAAAGVELRRQSIALDVVDEPVGLPLAAAVVGGALYVVNAASNDVSVIDLSTGDARAHVEVGDNPRGIAVAPDGSRVFVANTLSGTVSVIDTSSHAVVEEIEVTELPLAPAILNGKKLFNSSDTPELARDQWIACATCHFDGGMDGRTWFFRDGPRNTPALFGMAETLPLHWSGDLDEPQDVESTIRTIQAGTGLAPGTDNCDPACDRDRPNAGRSSALDDLAAYLLTLDLPAEPQYGPSAAELRGQALFMSDETGCAGCHAPPLFTDGERHDIGTGTLHFEARGTAFNTPSLRGVRTTPPYFHDGSAAGLRETLTVPAHSNAANLDAAQIDDLVAYLKSL